MLISEHLPQLTTSGRLKIFASDLPPRHIERCQEGEYNLMGSWNAIPRADIVLMRNVLIYFTPEVKTQLLAQVRRNVLRPGGAHFLGSSETVINLDDTLIRQQSGRCVYYQNPEK